MKLGDQCQIETPLVMKGEASCREQHKKSPTSTATLIFKAYIVFLAYVNILRNACFVLSFPRPQWQTAMIKRGPITTDLFRILFYLLYSLSLSKLLFRETQGDTLI